MNPVDASQALISSEREQLNRRLTERVPAHVTLTYSGMDQGEMLIGDGTVTNLSMTGIGIRGTKSVKPGMELALFIELPETEEPVCIAQSRVSWVNGIRFGVEMLSADLAAQNDLRFHVWNHQTKAKRR